MVEYGFEVGGFDYAQLPEWQTLLKESGAKWVHMGIYIGPLPGGDEDIIRAYRDYIKVIHGLGIKVIGTLGRELIEYAGEAFTVDDWRNLIRTAIYALGDLLDIVEIWNEPDGSEFYYGYMDGSPDHYFNLLQAAYEEIKALAPTSQF